MESQTDKQQNNQEDKEYYFLGIKQGFTDSQSPPQTKEFGRKHTIDVPFSVLKGKQRRFDRHSGTGRGKEIKKQGAGGKTVWEVTGLLLAMRSQEKNLTRKITK